MPLPLLLRTPYQCGEESVTSSSMTRGVAHSLVLSFLVVLLLALFSPLPAFAKDPATIVRVVDGDTIEVKLNDQKEKVRLIGVDTPEKFESDKLHRDAAHTGQDEKTIRALGERASDFTKSLVKRGDTVQLEYDQQQRDKYHLFDGLSHSEYPELR